MNIADAPYIAQCEKYGYENAGAWRGACYHCGGDLFVGSYVADIDGAAYCETCLVDMPLADLLAIFDVRLEEIR